MANTDHIRTAVEEIPAGTDVRLKLKDGTEVTGALRGASEDSITLDDSESVALELVDGVLLESVSPGPE